MASPRNVGTSSNNGGRCLSQSAGRRPSFTPGSQVAGTTPPVPQIPARVSGSFQPRPSFSTVMGPPVITPADSSSDTQLGNKMAVSPTTTTSALTASRVPTGSAVADDFSDDEEESAAEPARPDESAFSNLDEVTNEEKARVLRRHLVSTDERSSKVSTPTIRRSPSGTPMPSDNGAGDAAEESSVSRLDQSDLFPIPYDAPGSDVTHDLYKWQRRRPGRSASFSHADRSDIIDPALAQIKEPGGFRRNFVSRSAAERGVEEPPMIRNFVDFLYLYGHFAGEDLDEDEDLEDDDEDDAAAEEGRLGAHAGPSSERTPLLNRSLSKQRHKRAKSGPGQGTATMTQAVLMLLKGFVGTGVLFMGKAFYNGGILFSTVVLLAIAAISLVSFLLLVEAYLKVPASFGDLGGQLYGPSMRLAILISITVSQIGFVAAYTIFIADNLRAFILAVTDCKRDVPPSYLIFAQLLLFLPLSMIRNLAKLSGTALVADAFILVGLVYIAGSEISVLATKGIAKDVVLFNHSNFPLLIGTAVFAFEGIGLVIPITESMKEPHRIHQALTGVMFGVAILFTMFGLLGYAAYGSEIQTVVIVNLPQEAKVVQGVQFLYSLAILLSIPLQLFPAVRIMETGLFSRSGKYNTRVKWQKNIFRAGTVIFCSVLSWAGSQELDKFVSLVGAFACIPLCFIYPPMLHLRACATTRKAKMLDIVLILFGFIVGAYTTVQTLRSLFNSGTGEQPKFGKCEVPT